MRYVSFSERLANLNTRVMRTARRRHRFLPEVSSLEIRSLLSLTTINFDDLPNETLVSNQYASFGVNFESTAEVVSTGNEVYGIQMAARSGSNVVENDIFGESPGADLDVKDTAAPWTMVGGYVTGNQSITMTAYSSSNIVLGVASTGGNNNTLYSPPPHIGLIPGQPNELLEVRAIGITHVAFSGPGQFSLDDFHFSTSSPDSTISYLSYAFDNNNNQNSDGDLDLTYQISGPSLQGVQNLTYGVYWASGTSASTVIPDTTSIVITGTLDGTPGTHVAGITIPIVDLLRYPQKASNLIVILDNQRVVFQTNYNTSIGVINATALNTPLSFELQTLAPTALTRELRVLEFINNNTSIINKYAQEYNIPPEAIAGAIAWEAMQNVKTFFTLGVGLGKVHPFELLEPFNILRQAPAETIEGNTSYSQYVVPKPYQPGAYLPQQILARQAVLRTTNGAIQYIAAIMNAFVVEARNAGINLSTVAGVAGNYTQYVGLLDTLYNGFTIQGTPYASINGLPLNLKTAPFYFTFKASTNQPFAVNAFMGQWVVHNIDFIEAALLG